MPRSQGNWHGQRDALRALYSPNGPETQNPAGGRGFAETQTNGRGLQNDDTAKFHVDVVSADPLLQRLDGVQKSGAGWRARCPNCGGQSRKVAVTETPERVRVTCFSCHDTPAILAAVGLKLADLYPPRTWPESHEEQRRARRAMREAGWSAALPVLAVEGKVVEIAAHQLYAGVSLIEGDIERLALAVDRIEKAALVLVERETWKPDDCHEPLALVRRKHQAVIELQRQLTAAEKDLAAAEVAVLEAA